jgi:hypothetical protein
VRLSGQGRATRLLLEHNGEIQVHESHGRLDAARRKAELLRGDVHK